ncbi:TetR/AcrR family transcriptional regulator [Salinifilum aidingensis]
MTREPSTGSSPQRARRDPRGRRRAIVEAAAELIVEQGAGELTHRGVASRAQVSLGATTYYFATLHELEVAALQHLGAEISGWVDGVRRELDACGGDPAALCEFLRTYLQDRGQVRADFALIASAVDDPELRPLGQIWFDGLVSALAEHTDPDAARAIAVFSDGAVVHALLHDEPLDTAFLHRTVAALMSAEHGAEAGSGT